MKRHVLAMARFFHNYHHALELLEDEEYRILVWLAMDDLLQREKNDYSYYFVS